MQLLDGELVLSASDLTDFLACDHLTYLKQAVARGVIGADCAPTRDDAALELIVARGEAHEQRYLQHLRSDGRDVVEMPRVERASRAALHAAAEATVAAMRAGHEFIFQAVLFDGRWLGYADFLKRVETPSLLGAHSYEVMDTKLARHVKPAALVQLCSYAEHLARIQGVDPAEVHVILGDSSTHSYATREYALNRLG